MVKKVGRPKKKRTSSQIKKDQKAKKRAIARKRELKTRTQIKKGTKTKMTAAKKRIMANARKRASKEDEGKIYYRGTHCTNPPPCREHYKQFRLASTGEMCCRR